MARQSNTPVQFQNTRRGDETTLMSSGYAGKSIMVAYVPLLRGDSSSGKVGIDIDLAEMPRPLLNAVGLNAQAWFVPKSSHPKFAGYDEFLASYHGESITALGQSTRIPADFFRDSTSANFLNSEMAQTLGIHLPTDSRINTDLIDAYNVVHNFRLAAHSSRLERKEYYQENNNLASAFGPAFWPTGRRSRVVPDYERALVVGAFDFDVNAGRLPVHGLAYKPGPNNETGFETASDGTPAAPDKMREVRFDSDAAAREYPAEGSLPRIWADMVSQRVSVSTAEFDKARTTQAFAKLRATYAGNDPTGFANDDAIVADLMQGFSVPDEMFKRPWLLDSKRVTFGMTERYATDAANLDASVSQGRASATLSLNVPRTETGGHIIVLIEVLPERIDEAAADESLMITDVAQLPDALRDVQRIEPVDNVLNRRIDARHTSPDALYGFEPMNDVWDRDATRLGGVFYQADPTNPFVEQRSALWLANEPNPQFTRDHWLAPDDFPHYVFSDTTAPAFEFVVRHSVQISGLTQRGDVLMENNDDYDAIQIEGN